MKSKCSLQLAALLTSLLATTITFAQSSNLDSTDPKRLDTSIDPVREAERAIQSNCRLYENLVDPDLQTETAQDLEGTMDAELRIIEVQGLIESAFDSLAQAPKYPGSSRAKFIANFARKHCANLMNPKSLQLISGGSIR